ncbi:hypothetical protein KEM56_006679 [Ascosphaera pollenicola]|nr:hypothetical protein KEM56_006679 [Ascosphaera pollenicola]
MIQLPPDFHDRLYITESHLEEQSEQSSSSPTSSEKYEEGETSTLNPTHCHDLYRGLSSHHIQFYALSGEIGTGLFLGIGQILSTAGPLSALLVYIITGANILAVISGLGEMATWLPVSGGIPVFGKRFVSQSMGFALGWNYYYTIAMSVPLEISASSIIIRFWPNSVPEGVWITVLYLPMVIINSLPVRFYGETEFVFGAIKMITIAGLLILMLIIDLGGAPSHDRIGFRYWINPGPMSMYIASGALGRFLAFWKVVLQAQFSFGGSDTVIAAAGETKHPHKNIPKAVKRVFWRITLFYVLSVFLVGLCVSSKDPRLLDALKNQHDATAAQSPFVIAINNGGIKGIPHLINAILLCSVWSCGNSSFYVATRLLYATAMEGNGPSIFTRTKNGIPYACVALTAMIGLLAYLNLGTASSAVFYWFTNICAVSALIIWGSVGFTYLRFYGALKHHGISRDLLQFKSPFQPYLSYYSLAFCTIVVLFNGFDNFIPGRFSTRAFIIAYIACPVFFLFYFGHMLIYKTSIIPLDKVDLWTGREPIDISVDVEKKPQSRGLWRRLGGWLA